LPRKQRNWFPGAKYHITSRGIRKSTLFYDPGDYQVYLKLLRETKKKYPFTLHAYCLMTNHLHLQIETIDSPTGTIIQLIHYNYARYFNKKYGYNGHVFENRYGAEWIDSRKYELDVSKYIHLNPVAAKIVKNPEDYPWSSCRAYTQKHKDPLIHTDYILSHFKEPSSANYDKFIKTGL
jgi:putative transposase